jgi:anti-sigma B factor antagonist
MAPISITLENADPRTGVVRLLGEHDAYSAARLEHELALLVDEGSHVVVDLTDATFIDSHTLSVLLAARHRAERAARRFVLVLPHEDYTQVDRLLDITGLGRLFSVHRSLPEALDAARGGDGPKKSARAA